MPASPTVTMQGIEVPVASVDPAGFQKLTRRLTFSQKTFTYSGLGMTDTVQILQTGIISGLTIKASGTLTLTPGTGSIASTAKWPYDLLKNLKFSANGQSNLIQCSGSALKAREIMARGDLTDRGVVKQIGGASPGTSVQNGTLSLDNEAWGVGQSVTGLGAGTPAVELEWFVPVAFDQLALLGAIFAQTSSTDLTLSMDWAPVAELFTITGNATVALALTVNITGTVYTIPEGPHGIIVPDLSVFHSLIETRYNAVANGVNEIRLSGQGVGKQLLRAWFRVFSNGAPLPVNAVNFATYGWRYGGNDTPELYVDGRSLAYANEKLFNSNLAAYYGAGVLDFASENAFRDSIDEGTATELRAVIEIPGGVALTNPYATYVQETVAAGAAA